MLIVQSNQTTHYVLHTVLEWFWRNSNSGNFFSNFTLSLEAKALTSAALTLCHVRLARGEPRAAREAPVDIQRIIQPMGLKQLIEFGMMELIPTTLQQKSWRIPKCCKIRWLIFTCRLWRWSWSNLQQWATAKAGTGSGWNRSYLWMGQSCN